MAKVTIKPTPRQYNFNIGGYDFQCFVDWKSDLGVHPIEMLIDLEECLAQLRVMPRSKVEEAFKLPPLSPDVPQA